MKYIYIVFSHTNTDVGKFIRYMTRSYYNHASIALEPSLLEMYTFARLRRKPVFTGGFVKETPVRFLKNGEDITICVCRIPMCEDKYLRISNKIEHFKLTSGEYVYNLFNAFASFFRQRIKIKNAYTCIEFVSETSEYDPKLSIAQLRKKLSGYIWYEGSYKDYLEDFAEMPLSEEYLADDSDGYYHKVSYVQGLMEDASHFKKLVKYALLK